MQRAVLGTAGLLVVLGMTGCSNEPKLARVMGVVTLDGKPYPNALVSFQPIGSDENPNPGKGSVGRTDENGRYDLYCEERRGAVIGKHRVRITTVPGHGAGEDPNVSELGTPDDAPGVDQKGKMEFEPIPLEWNEKSEKTYEVKPEGTESANFDIVTPKKKKR
jgi:hypothetical protein